VQTDDDFEADAIPSKVMKEFLTNEKFKKQYDKFKILVSSI
jgi:hypothetical protein